MTMESLQASPDILRNCHEIQIPLLAPESSCSRTTTNSFRHGLHRAIYQMKLHNPIGNAAHHRHQGWHRRDMNHWRTESQWREALKRRLTRAMANHLASGGSIHEKGWQGAVLATWRLGDNCFIQPFKRDPFYIAAHLANRAIGFGFTLQLSSQ